jgi:hypothetical protein
MWANTDFLFRGEKMKKFQVTVEFLGNIENLRKKIS